MSKTNKESGAINAVVSQQDIDMEFLKSLDPGALDSLGQNDIIMPRYKLVQNTSRKGTPGKWANTLNADIEYDKLELIILQISNSRTYFPKKGENNDKPLCRSNDGYTKSDSSGIGDGNCNTCRYAKWVNGQKPPCSSGYTLLALILLPEGGVEPGMVSFRGAANKVCKNFFTRMKTRGISSLAYKVILTSESVVNDKGRFFLPVFDFGDYLTKEEAMFAAEQASIYKQYISKDYLADTSNDDEEHHYTASSSSAAATFLSSLDSDKAGNDQIEVSQEVPLYNDDMSLDMSF